MEASSTWSGKIRLPASRRSRMSRTRHHLFVPVDKITFPVFAEIVATGAEPPGQHVGVRNLDPQLQEAGRLNSAFLFCCFLTLRELFINMRVQNLITRTSRFSHWMSTDGSATEAVAVANSDFLFTAPIYSTVMHHFSFNSHLQHHLLKEQTG